jgi:hypothetical protein
MSPPRQIKRTLSHHVQKAIPARQAARKTAAAPGANDAKGMLEPNPTRTPRMPSTTAVTTGAECHLLGWLQFVQEGKKGGIT